MATAKQCDAQVDAILARLDAGEKVDLRKRGIRDTLERVDSGRWSLYRRTCRWYPQQDPGTPEFSRTDFRHEVAYMLHTGWTEEG